MLAIIYTKLQTPKGVRDFLPEETALKKYIENCCREIFKSWGYLEVMTPTFEFYDVLSTGGYSNADTLLYRFFDRDGEILVLRPDVTTPIARIAATKLTSWERPLRLCYIQNIFRYEDTQVGRQREFYQAGAELIGSKEPDADAEIIAMAAKMFADIGLKNFYIDIGQVGFFNGILEELDITESCQRKLRMLLYSKDFVGLKEFAEETAMDNQTRTLLLELRRLRGDFEGVIPHARALAKHERSHAALDNLSDIHAVLKMYGVADRVFLDLSMVKDLSYYTGMIMEGYISNSGYMLCTGGRYDNLLGEFGGTEPATGFAMGIERAMLAFRGQDLRVPEDDFVDYRFYFSPECRREVIQLVEALRAKGFRVQANVQRNERDKPKIKGIGRAKNTIVCSAGQCMYIDGNNEEFVFKDIQELGDFLCSI